MDGVPREIIGVLLDGFHIDSNGTRAIVIPFQFDRNKLDLGDFSFEGVGRLKPGVTIPQASADLARLMPVVNATFKPPSGTSLKLFEDARILPSLRPLKQEVIGDVSKFLWV